MSPDGTPVQVNNSALQEAVAQGSTGMSKQIDSEIEIVQKMIIDKNCQYREITQDVSS